MNNFEYHGKERRQFLRLSYKRPFEYKICDDKIISRLLSGYSRNVSQSGLLCNLEKSVPLRSTLWLHLDLSSLHICEEIEKRSVIVQKGILGKVAWRKKQNDGSYDVGIRFITRKEKDSIF